MENNNMNAAYESKLKSSAILRMIIIAGLTLVLLIPTLFIHFLISERASRRVTAGSEISLSWGGAQTIAGPILTIPYKVYSKNPQGDASFSLHYAYFLPSDLEIQGSVVPEIRYRGIYEVALYSANLLVSGQFSKPDFTGLRIPSENVLFEDAFVTFGISDLRGIREKPMIAWNDIQYPSEPTSPAADAKIPEIKFNPRFEQDRTSHRFSFRLNLNGSTELRFVPVGEITDVILESPWGNPGFVGSFLPHTRQIQSDSFSAEWKVVNLNRNIPQSWTGNRPAFQESSFGVSIRLPVDEYQKTERSVKYALLFIALTFVSFFLSELTMKTVFHPVQYALIGFALIIFYVLLLSLSEHMKFNVSYIIASLSVISLISAYAFWISRKKSMAIVIFAVLTALYVFLFVTLQLQDFALLLGSIGLFLVLLVIMYLTRAIDWYSLHQSEPYERNSP